MKINFLKINDLYEPALVITNPMPFDKKTKEALPDGVFSEVIFGSNLDEITYSCDCKHLVGKFYIDIECPNCKTKVRSRTKDFVVGWINLNCTIINPIYYIFVTKVIPKAQLAKIIEGITKVDSDGNAIESDFSEKTDTKYFQKGLNFFIENFDEILEFYYKKNKSNKEAVYNFIKENREFLFIENFPVIPPSLRPAMMVSDKLIFDEINNEYNQMLMNANSLKNASANSPISSSEIRNTVTEGIQILANQVFDKILEKLSGKNGLLRNNLLGSRFNFTSRMIIVPDNDCTIDEVTLPYLSFMELYKFEIINMLSKIRKSHYLNEYNIWHDALINPNPLIEKIIDEFEKGEHFIILNRNPTISVGSILLMKVRGVKRDMDDLTLGVPIGILSLQGADFDGDVLNALSIKDRQTLDALQPLKPSNLFLSVQDGTIEDALLPDRDILVGLSQIVKNTMFADEF